MTNVLCGRHCCINTITTEWTTTQLAISNILLSDATLCLTVTIIFENSARCNSNSHMQNNIQHIKLQLTYSITQSLFSCINRRATRAFSLTKYSSPHTTSPLTSQQLLCASVMAISLITVAVVVQEEAVQAHKGQRSGGDSWPPVWFPSPAVPTQSVQQ